MTFPLGGHALRIETVGNCAACGRGFVGDDLKLVAGEHYCRDCVPDEVDAFTPMPVDSRRVRPDNHWPHDQDGLFRCCGVTRD